MKMNVTDETRPRISFGVIICVSVCRMTTLTLSHTPVRARAMMESQSQCDTPKTMVATPKPSTAQRIVRARVVPGTQPHRDQRHADRAHRRRRAQDAVGRGAAMQDLVRVDRQAAPSRRPAARRRDRGTSWPAAGARAGRSGPRRAATPRSCGARSSTTGHARHREDEEREAQRHAARG